MLDRDSEGSSYQAGVIVQAGAVVHARVIVDVELRLLEGLGTGGRDSAFWVSIRRYKLDLPFRFLEEFCPYVFRRSYYGCDMPLLDGWWYLSYQPPMLSSVSWN